MKRLDRWEFRDKSNSKRKRNKREHTFDGDVVETRSIRPKNKVYCPDSGKPKMLFESEGEALRFMQYNSRDIEKENGKAPCRAYYCDLCCGWHLTSKKYTNFTKTRMRQTIDKMVEDDWPQYEYMLSILNALDVDIEVARTQDFSKKDFVLPEERDDDLYRGFIKRHNKLLERMARRGIDPKTYKQLMDFRSHVAKLIELRYRVCVR